MFFLCLYVSTECLPSRHLEDEIGVLFESVSIVSVFSW